MRKLFLSLLVVPFFSCLGTKESGSSVKNIVLDLNTNQELRLSEIADTVEMIPLEQVYDSDIAQVERIIPYKGHYYILNTIQFYFMKRASCYSNIKKLAFIPFLLFLKENLDLIVNSN